VKITNGEIYNDLRPALGKLIQIKLPVKTAFAVARFVSKVQELVTTIENVRNNLISQYGETDERTLRPIINQASQNWEAFVSEYNALMEIEVELPDTKIIIPDGVELEASVLLQLEKFVEVA
jgi:hypothetical protein